MGRMRTMRAESLVVLCMALVGAAVCSDVLGVAKELGVSSDTVASIPKVVLQDLEGSTASTPDEIGESHQDVAPATISKGDLKKMSVRKLRKMVMNRMREVQKLAKTKAQDLRKVDQGLVQERDYAESQARRWKAKGMIKQFDKLSTPDKYAGGMHTTRSKNFDDDHKDETDKPLKPIKGKPIQSSNSRHCTTFNFLDH